MFSLLFLLLIIVLGRLPKLIDMTFFFQKFAENQLRYCNRDYKGIFFFQVKIVLLALGKVIFVMIM